MENQAIRDLAIGAENLRRTFRQTMAANARRPGETLEETHARLLRDPATARVAETLGCTAAELLQGFGRAEEVFYVGDDYDHAQAEASVRAIVDRVAGAAMGTNDPRISDVVERRKGRTAAAPHVEERLGKIFGDERARLQIARARHNNNISRRR